jgi:hypothetical protein
LTIVIEEVSWAPPLLGLCAGYELDTWRGEAFAEYLMEWLPDFALTDRELKDLGGYSARRALRKAAKSLYQTEKYGRRGEFGELLLHAVLREYKSTIPAIKKIYFEDSVNDTVKGFDAVHIVEAADGLELWLGEVKFYKSLSSAMRDVVAELNLHSERDYLRNEFMLIANKLDPEWPHADDLAKLIDQTTSLDKIFKRMRVPVLLTYDSATTAAHSSHSEEYISKIAAELTEAHKSFVGLKPPIELVVHLVLIPLAEKKDLVDALESKLKGMQA